jgi:hypothetical protein
LSSPASALGNKVSDDGWTAEHFQDSRTLLGHKTAANDPKQQKAEIKNTSML